jgi:hypothetical protein
MANKKKQIPKVQHFVPQFFQRFFSYENNGKTISMFQTNSDVFKTHVKISDHLGRKHFYGSDGVLEEWLSKLESDSAPIFREMWENEKLPATRSPNHFKMLHFLVILDLRNPIHYKILKNFEHRLSNTKSKISEGNVSPDMIPGIQEQQSDKGKLSSMQSAELLVPDLLPLKYKLIKNNTLSPFIISDNPLVMYNQFLEQRNWKFGSQRDFGLKGLQLFLPLNDSYMLVVYDCGIYKLGNKKEQIVQIDDRNSIDQLNLLQFLNSETIVNFNHRATEHYIRTLQEKSRKYKKANEDFINVHKLRNPKEGNNFSAQLIEMGVSDLNVKLNVQKLNFISKSRTIKLRTITDQYRTNVKYKGHTHLVYTITPTQ